MNGLNVYQENRTSTAKEFKEELLSAEQVARRKDEKRKNQKKIPIWLKAGGAAIIILAICISVFFGKGEEDVLEKGQTYIPDIINLTEEQASEATKESGLDQLL